MTVPDDDAIRVVIAEDSAILRDGLHQLLSDRGFAVVRAVGDAVGLEQAVAEDPPDVAVVDIRMPPTFTDEGLRSAIRLRSDHPDVGILVFSQYVETRFAAELLAGGAAGIGYLLKDRVADVADFVEALVRVASGGTALDPEVVTQLMGASRRKDALSGLSTRERAGPGADGGRPHELRHRRRSRRFGRGRGEAHRQHLLQAGPARIVHRPPPGPGRAAVSRGMTRREATPGRIGHKSCRYASIRDPNTEPGWTSIIESLCQISPWRIR